MQKLQHQRKLRVLLAVWCDKFEFDLKPERVRQEINMLSVAAESAAANAVTNYYKEAADNKSVDQVNSSMRCLVLECVRAGDGG